MSWVRNNPLIALFIAVLLVGFIAIAGYFGLDLLRPDPTSTPAATGTANIANATAVNQPLPEITTTAAPLPTLTASFKNDPPVPNPIRVGENFTVWFQVDNTGQADAGNVILMVNTPPGLAAIEADNGCTNQGDNTVSCEFGPTGISAGSNGSKFITYRADVPVTAAFTPDTYSVSYNGASALVRGSEEWTASVESPRAAGVNLTAVSPELGADGVLTTTLNVEAKDQWGETFNGPATVELSIRREGAGEIAALPTPMVLPLTVSCTTTGLTTLTPQDEGETAQTEEFPADTPLPATAYDPANARLFVTATRIDGTAARGWVPWPADAALRTVRCPETELANLPAEPPQETAAPSPDGLILPALSQTFPQGSGTFSYQAGTVPGALRIVARLTDGASNSIAESEPATITLLETGSLGRSSHVFNAPADLTGNSPATMILFSMPTSTPLELYALDANAPNARKVALRVWVPSDVVGPEDESGQATLAASMPEGRSVSAGPEPPAAASAAQGEAQWQAGASGRPVLVLDERGGFKLVRITGWIPADALAVEE